MKTFKHVLCTSLLILLVAACGKDSKKSGSDPVALNPYYTDSLLSGDSLSNMSQFDAWYAGAEGPLPGAGRIVTVTKNVKVYNVANNGMSCEVKKILGVPFNYCSNFGGSQSTVITTSQVDTGLGNSSKGEVADLAAIANRAAGGLTPTNAIRVGTSVLGAPVIQYDFNRVDGSRVSYIVDFGRNSKVNPIEKTEFDVAGTTKTVTKLTHN